jgi:hypothetical protein
MKIVAWRQLTLKGVERRNFGQLDGGGRNLWRTARGPDFRFGFGFGDGMVAVCII